MKTRFDFEQEILDCWGVVEDLETLRQVSNLGKTLTPVELDNALLGLKTIYNFKFQVLFSTFEQMIAQNQLGEKSE